MIGIIDYGVGNLFSIQRSLDYIGVKSLITKEASQLSACQQIILPGVGAFADAKKQLDEVALTNVVCELAQQGMPLLGICLGMQLLFEESHEFGVHPGLGLIPGKVVSLKDALNEQNIDLKVPHIGWNALDIQKNSPLTANLKPKDQVYYVHSFYADCPKEYILETSEYGIEVTGMVQNKNIYGAQFHPEKSGDVGLAILKAFAEVKA